jgi:hypothetical protein
MLTHVVFSILYWTIFIFHGFYNNPRIVDTFEINNQIKSHEKGFHNNPVIIDTFEIHNKIKSYGLDEDLIKFKSHFFSSIIFKNDSIIFYNPNSTLHLFEIRLGNNLEVSKISKSVGSGHNYNRYLFTYNDVIYSYGGEGLFNTFPGLIYFEHSTGIWQRKKIENYPFDAQKVLNSWKIGNKMVVLLKHFSKPTKTAFDENIKISFGEIDLEEFKYISNFSFKGSYEELLFHSNLGFFRGNYIYDSDLYSLHGYYQENNNVEYRLFDKKSGSLIRNSILDTLKRVNGLSYIYIKDSTIYYRDQSGNIESFDVNSASVIHSKDFLKLYQSKSKSKLTYYFISIITLLLILVLIKRAKSYFSNALTEKPKKDLLIIEQKLKDQKPMIVSKEKLDELFGISHYSYETIKNRRSYIINCLNKNTIIKIERVRNDRDKRFFDYKIN